MPDSKPDIFPLTYRKGREYWHIYTKSGLKLCTINMSLSEPELIAKTIVEATNAAR